MSWPSREAQVPNSKPARRASPNCCRRSRRSLRRFQNLPHESVPVGKDETAKRRDRRWGTRALHFAVKGSRRSRQRRSASSISAPRPGFPAPLHADEGPSWPTCTVRFAQFMLDIHTQEHGYTEVYAPYLVNAASLFGTGQLPKFEEDLFRINQVPMPNHFYLIPHRRSAGDRIVRDEILAPRRCR